MRGKAGLGGVVTLASFLAACAGNTEQEAVKVQTETSTATINTVTSITIVDGQPTCASLGLQTLELSIAPVASGSYAIDDVGNSFTVKADADGKAFDWNASMSIDAVIAHGDGQAQVYKYAPFQVGGTRLSAPGGAPLQSISVCYAYELRTFKTATTSLKRAYQWSIEKSGDTSSLLLAPGESYDMRFAVGVAVSGETSSDYKATGQIMIRNPAPFPAEITGVENTFIENGQVGTPDCGVEFPYALPAGGLLVCNYTLSLDAPTNGKDKYVVSTSPTGYVKGHTNFATIDFGNATIDSIDECVDVTDDKYGPLGRVCADEGDMEFSYVMAIGPYTECGAHELANTASFVANDSGATGSDTWTVHSELPCPTDPGCTLTQGYWKTHSSYGPAPYDATWAKLPSGADTPFFSSGASYLSVLRTAPAGNPYYQLAHQYIAAELNQLDGADASAASAAFAEASALLSAYSPKAVQNLPRKSPVRDRFIALAGVLESYNSGDIGPGHCSESKECSPDDRIAKKKKMQQKLKKALHLLVEKLQKKH